MANSYLFDEGMAVSSFAFLLEGLSGAGADHFEAAELLPCEARYSAVVRQNKSTLLEKVFLNYLHVKQEEGQGSRR